MYPRRARALAGLLTLQAGLLAYSGARAARAFMEQAPDDSELRAFAPPQQPLEATPPASTPLGPALMPGFEPTPRYALDEIVDPWQPPPRPVISNAEIVDPWREPRPAADVELLDPWRHERVASREPTTAGVDWAASGTEPLDPWPVARVAPDFELNELVDPWSSK